MKVKKCATDSYQTEPDHLYDIKSCSYIYCIYTFLWFHFFQTGSQCTITIFSKYSYIYIKLTLNHTQEPKPVASLHWPLTHPIYSVENVPVNIILGINSKGGVWRLVVVFEEKVLEGHSVLLLEGHHYLVAEAEHHQLQQRREFEMTSDKEERDKSNSGQTLVTSHTTESFGAAHHSNIHMHRWSRYW